jgi:hypothetical protein
LKLRYAIAQALVLVLWALDWYRRGASYTQKPFFDSLLGSFLIILFFTGIPAILVAAIDGSVGRRRESIARNMALSALVVGLALWVSKVGIDALAAEDLFGQANQAPSVTYRINHLICMEIVFLFEFGMAASIRRLRET